MTSNSVFWLVFGSGVLTGLFLFAMVYSLLFIL